MINFERNDIYAQNVIDENFDGLPLGVRGNQGSIEVSFDEALGEDNPNFRTAVSLPTDKFIEVNFGDNAIVDGEGADIELDSYGSATSEVKFEITVTATFNDGTQVSETFEDDEPTTRVQGGKSLLDLNDFNQPGIFINPNPNASEEDQEIAFLSANSLKITGQDDSGASEGYEVYEVKGNYGYSIDRLNLIQNNLEISLDPFTGFDNTNSSNDPFSGGQLRPDIQEDVNQRVKDIFGETGFNILDTNGDDNFNLNDVSDILLVAGVATGVLSSGVAGLGLVGLGIIASGFAGGGFEPFGFDIGLSNLENIPFLNETLQFIDQNTPR